MYPCTRDVLHQILYLIDRDKFSQAVQVWSSHRRDDLQACGECHYEEFGLADHECCMCLESKLRTLSLYEHEPEPYDTMLQTAARKLHEFHCA